MSRRPYIPGTEWPSVQVIGLCAVQDPTKSVRDRATLDTPERRTLRERYARNHPDVVDGIAYERGQDARKDGLPLTACPYIDGDEATEWRNGWHALRAEVDPPAGPACAKEAA